MALCQEQALLHTFVAGQKCGVWRDATRRSRFVTIGIVHEQKININQDRRGCPTATSFSLWRQRKRSKRKLGAALGMDVSMASLISNGL